MPGALLLAGLFGWLSAGMSTSESEAYILAGGIAGELTLTSGSIYGTPGDGSGDLDRLIAVHAWTPDGIAALYAGLSRLSGFAMLIVWAVYATRAVRRLRAR